MKKQLTVVSPSAHITMQELEQRIIATREKYSACLQQYHEAWYDSGHTWVYTNFLGIGMMKSPNDLWAYQDIMVQHRPKTVIETGTYQGASALWIACLMDLLNIEGGRVHTVDIEDRRKAEHPRITAYGGDSADPELVQTIADQIDGKVLVILDSDHSEAHVRAELELYAPLTRPGDWVVVEDTNVGWVNNEHPELSDRGARGGLEDYLLAHPGEFRQDLLSERYLLTMNPGGWLQRMAGGRA